MKKLHKTSKAFFNALLTFLTDGFCRQILNFLPEPYRANLSTLNSTQVFDIQLVLWSQYIFIWKVAKWIHFRLCIRKAILGRHPSFKLSKPIQICLFEKNWWPNWDSEGSLGCCSRSIMKFWLHSLVQEITHHDPMDDNIGSKLEIMVN